MSAVSTVMAGMVVVRRVVRMETVGMVVVLVLVVVVMMEVV